jgi:hypothetical protein
MGSNSVRTISFERPALAYAGKLTATDDHLFWVDGRGWTAARELQAGDQLLRSTGGSVVITANQPLPEKSKVYTLWLRKDHAFYANDVLVHDLCGEVVPVGVEQNIGVAK